MTQQVVANSAELLVVEFRFSRRRRRRALLLRHSTSAYVQSGRFAFTVNRETLEIGRGDNFRATRLREHDFKAQEKGTFIDTLTLRRDDAV
nr:hypothetical protein [Marinicella sp. W31]MDC2879757.1 hypothetical protein [Marinicella sp. W31]